MPADHVVLSPLAADTACQRLRVGLPSMLDLPSHGATGDERASWLRRGWQELLGDGLADGDELAPFVAESLRTLNRPELQLTAVIAEAVGSSTQAVLAAVGDFALLARVVDGGLALESVPMSGLARIAVGLLPEVAAGPGQSVSLLSESVESAIAAAAGVPVDLAAELRGRGLRAEEARFLAGVLGAQRLLAAQFGGRGFDLLSGRTNWSPVTVDVLDTEAGRYFAQHRRGQDGRKWFIVAPTDRRRLLDRVGELVRQIQPTR